MQNLKEVTARPSPKAELLAMLDVLSEKVGANPSAQSSLDRVRNWASVSL